MVTRRAAQAALRSIIHRAHPACPFHDQFWRACQACERIRQFSGTQDVGTVSTRKLNRINPQLLSHLSAPELSSHRTLTKTGLLWFWGSFFGDGGMRL